MGEWKLFKLEFGRNLAHFGELDIGMESTNEMIHSDTLFSAWVATYVRLFGKEEVRKLLAKFNSGNEPPFRLSSTFIYRMKDEKIIYYLPRPLQRPLNYPKDDLKFAKEYKKLNYLPLSVWQRWYQGEGFIKEDGEELTAKKDKAQTPHNQLKNAGVFDYGEASTKIKIPKTSIDRTTRASNIYHVQFVRYKWEANGNEVKSLAGLYFLAYFSDPNLATIFSMVLNFLGEDGIGGVRSSGAGQFRAKEEVPLDSEWESVLNFSEAKSHSLISLFWDNNRDVINPNNLQTSSYELLKRSGWVAASPTGMQRRRQSIQMFAEGSVFPFKPGGKLEDVTPEGFTDHRVYRSGISLSLPMKIETEEIKENDCN